MPFHELADIDQPGGGLMLQMPLTHAAALGLPLPDDGNIAETTA
jgi:hypothetical protein